MTASDVSTDDATSGEPSLPRRDAWLARVRSVVPIVPIVHRPFFAPLVVAALAALAYGVFAVEQFNRLVSRSWDLTIFEQAIKGYAHLNAPIATIKGEDYNLLGDHFHPAIAVLAPVYRLFPSPVTLLLAQVLLIAVSVYVVTRCAIRVLGLPAGVGIGAAYAVSWGLQTAVAVQFHEIALAVPLITLSLSALLRERYDLCALWAMPLVFVKEDLGLTVAAIGIVLVIKGQRRLGGVLAGYGVACFLVTVYVILPALNKGGTWEYSGKLTGGGGIGDVLAMPLDLVHPTTKLVTLFLVFGITGFVALRSPIAIVAIPTLAWRFIADQPEYWGRDWHYSAVLMPIVFLALVDGLPRLAASGRAVLRWYASVAVPVVVTVALMLLAQYPLEVLADPATYRATAREAEAARILDAIDDGAVVETNVGLMSHFADRTTVYWTDRPGNPVPDYVLVEGEGNGTDVAAYAESLHPGQDFEERLVAGPFRLAVRSG